MRTIFRTEEAEKRPGTKSRGRFFALLCFILCPAVFSLSASAARIYPSAGSSAAAFLKIGVGARALGMAGAYTSLSGDPYAMYWNPAGLAGVEDRSLAFTHSEYFAGLSQEYMSYVMPAPVAALLPDNSPKSRVMGFSLNYFYTGSDLERRSGNYEAGNNISPVEGKFGAYDLAFSFGYGVNHSRSFKTGAAVKLIRQSIDTESGAGAALDLGALYDFNWLGRKFTAGFAAQNIGPGIKFTARRYPLPLIFRAGLSHRLYKKGPLMALDAYKPVDNYPSLALGVEQQLGNRLFLRSGYSYRQHGNESGGLSGLALGLGFISGRFSFDYALLPFGDLGNTHRLSAAMRFSGPESAKGPRAAQPAAVAGALAAARALALTLDQKPLALSRSGISYLVRAAIAPGPDGSYGADGLRSLSFVTFTRGQGRAEVNIYEGELSAELLGKLPLSPGRVHAWRADIAAGGVIRGEVKFEFEFDPGVSADFYRLVGGGWEKSEVRAGACGEKACGYSASAPLSTHYALVVRQ